MTILNIFIDLHGNSVIVPMVSTTDVANYTLSISTMKMFKLPYPEEISGHKKNIRQP